jgi:hypothetical protein
VLPFLLLITRLTKRSRGTLVFAAWWLLAVHWLDMAWLVWPQAVIPHGTMNVADVAVTRVSAMDFGLGLLCFVGVGGVAFWAVVGRLGRAALIPQRDPRLATSLAFENY